MINKLGSDTWKRQTKTKTRSRTLLKGLINLYAKRRAGEVLPFP